MEYMFLPLKRFFDFQGRSRRKEFWMFFLFQVIVFFVASIIDVSLGYGSAESYAGADGVGASFQANGPAFLIAMLALLIPALAVAVRRLHDTDRSGWWVLIGIIPLIGWIVLIVFYCLDGTPGENRFGHNPKDPTGPDVAQVFS